MKAVILAAGLGSRISAASGGHPKCLLSIEGRTILDMQLAGLDRAGISEIAIVVGYRADEIVRHVAKRHAGKVDRIEIITNDRFRTTNNMYSLWLARPWVGPDAFVCLNADVLCDPDLLVAARSAGGDICLLVDPEYHEETTKVRIEGRRVVELRKSLSREDYSATFANLATFSPGGARRLFDEAEALFAKGEWNVFFNDVIGRLAARGVAVGYADTRGLAWSEVDDPADWEVACRDVYPRVAASFDAAEHNLGPANHARATGIWA